MRICPLVLLVALSLATSSCGRAKNPSGPPEASATPTSEMPAAPPALNAPPTPSPQPTPGGPTGVGQADLDAVNQALRQYVRVKKVVPRDVQELVSSGFVPSLPSPPAGKKYVILLHPLGYSVVLADQ